MKGGLIYFPALSVNTRFLEKDMRHPVNNKSLRFYTKEGIWYYPFILISAGHRYTEENTVEKLGIPIKHTLVLGDSGGFQIAMGVIKNTEENRRLIFRWLENNVTIAATLDYPPFAPNKDSATETFNDALEMSVDNFEYFIKNRSGKVKYLNVLHGREEEQIQLWYDRVKHFDFKGGWAIGSVRGNDYPILYALFYLLEKGEFEKFSKRQKFSLFHVFGTSKVRTLAFLAYFQYKLKKLYPNIRISCDSSSFTQLVVYGKVPFDNYWLGTRIIHLNFDALAQLYERGGDEPLPCNCPVCKDLTWKKLADIYNENRTLYYNLMQIHNLYRYVRMVRQFENVLGSNIESIWDDYFFTTEVSKLIRIMDKAFESDRPAETFRKYKSLFQSIQKDNVVKVMEF